MNRKQAERLKLDDIVVFSDGCQGRVIELGYCRARIAWNDGQTGVVHFDDMQDITKPTEELR